MTMLGNSTLALGKASYTATSLSLGSNVLSAVYSGDSADAASTSAPVNVQVTPAVTPPAAVTIDPSNPAILYSPYNWSVTQVYARTINSGAYFRTVFSGTSMTLLTDTTPNQPAFSEFWARIDNQGWSQYSLSAGSPQIPVATNLANRKHVLEVVIKSTSQYLPRWTNSQSVVQFTGLLLDAGASVYAPLRRSKNVLILGDSITEGVHALGNTATLDTDQNDILGDYSYVTATALDAEVGIVAFGAQGVTEGGSGSVPPLTSTYNQIFDGVARDFKTYPPDLVIYNEGTNDFLYNVAAPSFVSAYTSVIQGILAAAPNSKHLVLIPFDQAYAAIIPGMAQAFGSAQMSYGVTAGWFDPAESSDGIHPYNYEHIAYIAPKLIPLAVQQLR
jgi:hypothetical protein